MHCIERASSKEHGIVLVIGGNSGGGDSAGVGWRWFDWFDIQRLLSLHIFCVSWY